MSDNDLVAQIRRRLTENFPNMTSLLKQIAKEYDEARSALEEAIARPENAARDALNDAALHEQLVARMRTLLAGQVGISYRDMLPVEDDK